MSQPDPVVFISYCWEDAAHQEWVLQLADRLSLHKVDVLLDRFLNLGRNLYTFMEESIKKSKVILVVCTPEYYQKASNRTGGVGYEYSLITDEISKNIAGNKKVIPVLVKGSRDNVPGILRQYLYLDFRDNAVFETRYEELIRQIYDEPYFVKFRGGKKPEFKPRVISTGNFEKENISTVPAYQPPLNFSLAVLEDHLKNKRFREADVETLHLFQRYFGKSNETFKREFVNDLPYDIFDSIDKLWLLHSEGKFGFSIQFRIWKQLGGLNYSFGVFEKFSEMNGWAKNKKLIQNHASLTFDLSAPDGHLPTLKQSDYNKSDWSIAWTDNFKTFLNKNLNR